MHRDEGGRAACRSKPGVLFRRPACGPRAVDFGLPLPLGALDMDYSCLAVPAEVGYRHPESGAGAVMSRQANRADSFPSVREAPGPARASRSPRPTPQETRKIALYPQNLEGEV